jgi:hypothetical protein
MGRDYSSGGEGINYVVTGLSRSGTTYMMRCIEAGGIPVAYSTHRYELNKTNRWPILKDFKGQCFKMFMCRLVRYKDVSKMRILCMLRNPYKILESNIRFRGAIPTWLATVSESLRYHEYKIDLSQYEKKKKECAEWWGKEAVSYTECQLESMNTYERRIDFFTLLKKEGWPIDVEKAASVENDEEYRSSLETKRYRW